MNTDPTFAEKAFNFYARLELPKILPAGILAMNPYQDEKTREYSRLFLRKFYADNQKRVFVFGINPGRFGAGVTGVTFTDPVALKMACGISKDRKSGGEGKRGDIG